MGQYVALLRGINVGGQNLVRMSDLVTCFEEHGFRNVTTFIQSGNVLFEVSVAPAATLIGRIEAMLGTAFGRRASIVLLTAKQLRQVVEYAPDRFGASPAEYRYDVLYLMPSLSPARMLKAVALKEGVDQAHPGPRVVYFSRLIRRQSQSRLSRIVSTPIYQHVTIRNWNTTTKLLQLLDHRSRMAAAKRRALPR